MRAQQSNPLRRIGVLMGVANDRFQDGSKTFQQELARLGWTEDRNIAIEYRWAAGQTEQLVELATDLVRLNVEVIVTQGTPPTAAAKRATSYGLSRCHLRLARQLSKKRRAQPSLS
jgi:putative ABC transport system substrate-binding protein